MSSFPYCSGGHDVGKKCKHFAALITRCRSLAKNKLLLNLTIQLCLNNVTNRHQLIAQSTTSCCTAWRSYRGHRLLWVT